MHPRLAPVPSSASATSLLAWIASLAALALGCGGADTTADAASSGTSTATSTSTGGDPTDGTACDDGDACTQDDTYQGGVCTAGPPVACDAPGACRVAGACDPATGECSNPAAPDGAACDDGDPCTQTDTCQSGACAGASPLACGTGAQSAPALSCSAILLAGHSAGDGLYWLSQAGGDPYQAYCDMTVDGGGYTRFRTLTIPADTGAGWKSAAQVPYSVALAAMPDAERVLVKMTLDGHYAWASWDIGDDAADTWMLTFDAPIRGSLPGGRYGIDSAAASPATIGIQSWSECYEVNPATGKYEWGNVVSAGTGPCYGTFSFFADTSTVFAFDRWAQGGAVDIGIGPQAAGNPDWTFANNGASYATRALEWYVASSRVAPDECHDAAACDAATGQCGYPAKVDGAACDDGNLCTTDDTCQAGACAGGPPPACDGSIKDCKAILAENPLAADGIYTLERPDGTPYDAYCNMTLDGGGYTRFRTLDIPASLGAAWQNAGQIPYANAVSGLPSLGRVLVKLALDGHYAWASWDTGTFAPETWLLHFGDPIQTYLPDGRYGIDSAAGAATKLGIQSWAQCYAPNGATQKYEWGNVPYGADPCYGTFSFFGGPGTVFGFDRWAGGGALDLGIGTQPAGNPDWTFASNAGNYGARVLEWYARADVGACREAGACDPATGQCGYPAKPDGTACDDGTACTQADACQGAVCTGGDPVVCGVGGPNGICPGTCDAVTGQCDFPEQACTSSAYINHVLITGQSLSTGTTSNVVSVTQPYENVSFNTGVRAGGSGLSSFIPLVETSNGGEGETIASGMANLATSLAITAGFSSSPFLLSCNGVGGQPYSALKKGTVPYGNGIAQITAGKAISDSLGQSYALRAVFLVHGESDHLGGNQAYEADLAEWQHDYETDAKAITEQQGVIPMFLCQMSSYTAYGQATSIIPAAELASSIDFPGLFYVVGPKYFLPYTDGVHLSGDGERRLGEYYAKAFDKVMVGGAPWVPVSPQTVTRAGAVITVDFNVPAPPLVLDTASVSDPGHDGFEYTDASGSPPAITSVQVTGPTTVKITLQAAPVGANKRIRYAYTGIPGQPAGPTTGARGNLRDSDVTPSLGGYPLQNWCVHFDRAVP